MLVRTRLACLLRVWFLICIGTSLVEAQDRTGWPAVPPEDLALADNPAKLGSSAMILIKNETRDDAKRTWETYYRIKIFTESGREYGDIEIPYVPKRADVDNISARVVQPDGRVSEFRGPIYEKTLARQGKTRLMAKTFTLPEVGPGVIIDYRYTMKLNSERPSGPWIIQEKLFIREANLEWRPWISDSYFYKILPRSLPGPDPMIADAKNIGRATLRNLPPFQQEPFMPPEATLKMRYLVMYEPLESETIVREFVQKYLNDFIGKPNALTATVRELTGTQDSPETKVTKFYKAVQERVRNLSNEETFTKRERQRESIRERKSALDVWRFGYGTEEEINLLFAALCRAAGLYADPVGVVQRENGFYDSQVRKLNQLDGWLVAVELPGGTRFFDPVVRFAPLGWISWQKQGVAGIRFGAELLVTDVDVPLERADENRLLQELTLTLQPDGSAQVQLVTTYTGEEAIDRRNDFLELSKDERERQLRNELKELFPAAHIQEMTWEGTDDAGDQAKISYRFDLPDQGQPLGSRILVDSELVQRSSPFPSWRRTHAVYFRRSIDEVQDVRIIPPPGYELEDLPPPIRHDLTIDNSTLGIYESATKLENGAILRRAHLTRLAEVIPVEAYLGVKRFYDQIAAAERSRLVLKKQIPE